MSEVSLAGPVPATAGALLRQAREASGLHVAALAVSLKVSVKKLEALEADRFDLLPDMVFVRALAASVCRVLKIDSNPVLALLPKSQAPKLDGDGVGINTPFRTPNEQQQTSRLGQLSKPVVLAVFALLLAAVIIIFLPELHTTGSLQSVKRELLTTPDLTPDNAAAPVAAAPVLAASAPPNADAVPTNLSASTPPPATPTVTEPAPAAPPAPSVAAPIEEKTAAPAPTALVQFRARGSSWVEVSDARGNVVLRRTLQSGESTSTSGTLPLSVVVGKADVTEVHVRGKGLDLAPLARDNVARFQVK